MSALLLAPYNDSMQLGQGYNSFLLHPCVEGAVSFPKDSGITKTQAMRNGGPGSVSQVVSYSSRFVDKISDVVRSMNISAAASIKSGTVESSGNSMSLDESKFAASDMNAVVSVKVVNQTTQPAGSPKFNPMMDSKGQEILLDSGTFFDYYGDCYISGFMEGGDLHGIVSIKVLDVTKKTEIEEALKSQMNSANKEFTLSEGSGLSTTMAALSQTESTITVSWSGGGIIKPDDEEWTMDSLTQAAAAFPSRVANCPQRTWAILTKYDNNKSFLEWSHGKNIVVPQFDAVQQFTSDLLDTYMQFKNNFRLVQNVMANTKAYRINPEAQQPVSVTVKDLVKERTMIRREMALIVDIIDKMNRNPVIPGDLDDQIASPEIWATRLPVLVETPLERAQFDPGKVVQLLSGFAFDDNPAVQRNLGIEAPIVDGKPLEPLADAKAMETMLQSERDWLNNPENRRKYQNYRWDRAINPKLFTQNFNDAIRLMDVPNFVGKPIGYVFELTNRGERPILTFVKTRYNLVECEHGFRKQGCVYPEGSHSLGFEDRLLTRMSAGTALQSDGTYAIEWLQVECPGTNSFWTFGDKSRVESYVDWAAPPGFPYVAGFWGDYKIASGDPIRKLGIIWGREPEPSP